MLATMIVRCLILSWLWPHWNVVHILPYVLNKFSSSLSAHPLWARTSWFLSLSKQKIKSNSTQYNCCCDHVTTFVSYAAESIRDCLITLPKMNVYRNYLVCKSCRLNTVWYLTHILVRYINYTWYENNATDAAIKMWTLLTVCCPDRPTV